MSATLSQNCRTSAELKRLSGSMRLLEALLPERSDLIADDADQKRQDAGNHHHRGEGRETETIGDRTPRTVDPRGNDLNCAQYEKESKRLEENEDPNQQREALETVTDDADTRSSSAPASDDFDPLDTVLAFDHQHGRGGRRTESV